MKEGTNKGGLNRNEMGGSHWDCRWLERREASGKKKNRSLLW